MRPDGRGGTRGEQPPRVRSGIPGRRSCALARRLAAVESRNVTLLTPDFPIFWDRARGSNVWDADGNRYVDLSAGFAVAAAGHRHPRIQRAIRRQSARLVHGLGDVHPPEAKVRLLERLARLAPEPGMRGMLGTSGAEAVEIALKTARLATGRPGVLAFSGAYHGLTYGALAVTDGQRFRAPFEDQLLPRVVRAPFPHPYRPPQALAERAGEGAGPEERCRAALEEVAARLDGPGGDAVGAVIVEPVQGRGGEVVPPAGFLAGLAALCRERGRLLIADEVYTGFGRTGFRYACDAEGVVPDLLCLGKGMSGGLPISACLGRESVMEAWPPSDGEAMHTTTFLGNPVAAAAGAASLEVIEREGLAERSREEGARWLEALRGLAERHPAVGDVRGRGLMIGLDLVRDPETREPDSGLAGRVVVGALRRGWILLAGGPAGNVVSLSPPLTIRRGLLDGATRMLDEVLAASAAG